MLKRGDANKTIAQLTGEEIDEGKMQKEMEDFYASREEYPNAIMEKKEKAYGSDEKAESALRNLEDSLQRVTVERVHPKLSRTELVQKFKKTKRVDFTGQVVKNSQEIAQLFQAYRNPAVDLFHVIYLDKDGKILAHNLITSGVVDMGYVSHKMYNFDVPERAKKLGPKQVYIMHNHPSGNILIINGTDSFFWEMRECIRWKTEPVPIDSKGMDNLSIPFLCIDIEGCCASCSIILQNDIIPR